MVRKKAGPKLQTWVRRIICRCKDTDNNWWGLCDKKLKIEGPVAGHELKTEL